MVGILRRRNEMKIAGGEIVLPTGYTKVSSVGRKTVTTGIKRCPIDTGVVATNATKIWVRYKFVGTSENANQLMGSAGANNGTGGVIIFFNALRWGSGAIGSWTAPADNSLHDVTVWHDGTNIHYEDTEDETAWSGAPGGNATANVSLYLLGRNNQNTPYASSPTCLVYGMKIWESGTLIRDFIPCLRDADSTPGFFDVAGSQFYTAYSGSLSVNLEYEV